MTAGEESNYKKAMARLGRDHHSLCLAKKIAGMIAERTKDPLIKKWAEQIVRDNSDKSDVD